MHSFDSERRGNGLTRRRFVGTAGAAVAAKALSGEVTAVAAPTAPRGLVGPLEANVERAWIGPDYWGNRLQDWRLAAGRIECVAEAGRGSIRTVGVLTREVTPDAPVRLRIRTGTLSDGAGFSGFLLGAGAGRLDPRAAALVQGPSGIGGGLLFVYGSDGAVAVREHTDEQAPQAYAPIVVGEPGRARSTAEDVELRLDVAPVGGGRARVRLAAIDVTSGETLSEVESERSRDELEGGLSLVSSEDPAAPGARYWLADLRATGDGVATKPRRAFGPIAGTLFSVDRGTLKMTAQLLPQAATDPREVRLEFEDRRGGWRLAARAPVEAGYCAQLRVENVDTSRARRYRVRYGRNAEYRGTIPAEPRGRPLRIGTINCVISAQRGLSNPTPYESRLPGERALGLHTPENLYFPHAPMADNLAAAAPDLLTVFGDQLYEGSPTVKDPARAPELDYLYKYLLWLWSFREITKSTPAIVMVDDHDVFQGNIWGWEGRAAPNGEQNRGGYVNDAAWVNMVQRTQCGHDPDPYDPTPVQQGIEVYYCEFVYGGVSFAVLEDRKFKTTTADSVTDEPPPPSLELLGRRQEEFLADWGRRQRGRPKVVLTQTTLACLQTDPDGQPIADADSNGAPKQARDRAVALLGEAGAIILSGDQHLGAVVRHGIEGFDDGPLQFASPAGGSRFQRWFEPQPALENPTGEPDTGDFTDGYGNRLRVLAVANPRVTFAEYRQGYPTGQGLGDRRLKREGYGIVDVDPERGRARLECWPWNRQPSRDGSGQFPGWPINVKLRRPS